MRLGMTLGIIGGSLALVFGIIMAAIGTAIGGGATQLGASDVAARSGLMTVVSLAVPVSAIVGSVMLPKNLSLALVCMGIPAALLLGFGLMDQVWLLVIMGALIAAGAYFGWADHKSAVAER